MCPPIAPRIPGIEVPGIEVPETPLIEVPETPLIKGARDTPVPRIEVPPRSRCCSVSRCPYRGARDTRGAPRVEVPRVAVPETPRGAAVPSIREPGAIRADRLTLEEQRESALAPMPTQVEAAAGLTKGADGGNDPSGNSELLPERKQAAANRNASTKAA
jgi:hypothetical protein